MTDYAVSKIPFVHYSGSNSAAILARYDPALVQSQHVAGDGTITLVDIYNTTLTIPANTYVMGWGNITADWVMTPSQLAASYYLVSGNTAPGPAPAYTLFTAVGDTALPALTLLSPNFTASITFDKPMPAGTTPADLHWRARAGAAVLSAIQLQAIASPVVLVTNPATGLVTGVTLYLRAVGVATVAGIVTVETHRLVQS